MSIQDRWHEYQALPASEIMDSEAHTHEIGEAVLAIPSDTRSVLCIGCGDGTEMKLVESLPLRLERLAGIHLNAQQAEQVRAKGLECHVMDMHDMSFADAEFDLCFSHDCYEHALSPVIAMGEMCRVARRYVLVHVPSEDWQFSGWHYVLPTRLQIASLAVKFGYLLADERSDSAGGSIYVFKRSDVSAFARYSSQEYYGAYQRGLLAAS